MDSKPVMDVAGWEAFVHGVFAIVVTLLVLDIRVPDSASIDSGPALQQALLDEVPRYAAYVLGFLSIGAYWINVHRVLRTLRGIDHGFIVLGLVFLMVIAAAPFATALLAEYIGAGNGQDQVALVIFTSWQLVLALLGYLSIRYVVTKRRLLVRAGVAGDSLAVWLRITALGPLIWLVALATAVVANSTITLVLITIVFAIFLFEMPVREEPAGADS